MTNYSQIDKLFGTPLNIVPKPHVPFKMKTSYWIAGTIAIALMCYGAYTIYKDASKLMTDNSKQTPGEFLANLGKRH